MTPEIEKNGNKLPRDKEKSQKLKQSYLKPLQLPFECTVQPHNSEFTKTSVCNACGYSNVNSRVPTFRIVESSNLSHPQFKTVGKLKCDDAHAEKAQINASKIIHTGQNKSLIKKSDKQLTNFAKKLIVTQDECYSKNLKRQDSHEPYISIPIIEKSINNSNNAEFDKNQKQEIKQNLSSRNGSLVQALIGVCGMDSHITKMLCKTLDQELESCKSTKSNSKFKSNKTRRQTDKTLKLSESITSTAIAVNEELEPFVSEYNCSDNSIVNNPKNTSGCFYKFKHFEKSKYFLAKCKFSSPYSTSVNRYIDYSNTVKDMQDNLSVIEFRTKDIEESIRDIRKDIFRCLLLQNRHIHKSYPAFKYSFSRLEDINENYFYEDELQLSNTPNSQFDIHEHTNKNDSYHRSVLQLLTAFMFGVFYGNLLGFGCSRYSF